MAIQGSQWWLVHHISLYNLLMLPSAISTLAKLYSPSSNVKRTLIKLTPGKHNLFLLWPSRVDGTVKHIFRCNSSAPPSASQLKQNFYSYHHQYLTDIGGSYCCLLSCRLQSPLWSLPRNVHTTAKRVHCVDITEIIGVEVEAFTSRLFDTGTAVLEKKF